MTTTVDIPGGQANLFERHELKERRRRLVRNAALVAAPVLARIPDQVLQQAADAAKVAAENPESQEAAAALEVANRAVEEAMKGLDLEMRDAAKLDQMQDATIVALLESWTLPAPLPTMDTVQDLDPDVYDALAQATKTTGAALALDSVDFSPSPDHDSPTGPSSDSDGRLRDGQTASTSASLTGGENTSTESYIPV